MEENKQKVIAIIISANSDMIPAIELAKEAKVRANGYELSIPTKWKNLQNTTKK